jgi:hypothetical protein
VAVDTTVQEKAIAHPTEHGLLRTAIEQLGRQAKKAGLRLPQSYVRVARRAAMKTGRYLHAQQKRRAKRQVKFLRVRLRRLIRDVRRKMAALPALAGSSVERLEHALGRASRSSGAAIEITFIPGTRRKPNASARAKRVLPTNSAAKFPSPRICIRPRAGTSSCRCAPCTAIRTMATR